MTFELLNSRVLSKFPILLTTDLKLLAYCVTFMKRTKKKSRLFLKLHWNVSECSDPPVEACPFTRLACFPPGFSLLILYVSSQRAVSDTILNLAFSFICICACFHKLRGLLFIVKITMWNLHFDSLRFTHLCEYNFIFKLLSL